MHFVVVGLITSTILLVLAILLFRFETRRGVRIGERIRQHLDFAVLKVMQAIRHVSWFLGRDFIRQIFHYLFHSALRLILNFVRRCEQGLKNAMRVNKTLAKNAERENLTRSKLEEVALHKVASALSEEEKKVRKDKTLRGM